MKKIILEIKGKKYSLQETKGPKRFGKARSIAVDDHGNPVCTCTDSFTCGNCLKNAPSTYGALQGKSKKTEAFTPAVLGNIASLISAVAMLGTLGLIAKDQVDDIIWKLKMKKRKRPPGQNGGQSYVDYGRPGTNRRPKVR